MVIEAATGLAPPLCVDLDRTLIRGDLLLESLVLLVKRNPLYLLLIPFWLLRGKAALEARVLRQVTLNPEALPYNPGLIEWLQRERANGRSVWLVTASHEKLADRVAAHLGFFEGVLASNERSNLAAATKAAQLVNRFGERGFDYCGNDRDVTIWERARGAIVVEGSPRLERQAATRAVLVGSFPSTTSRWTALLRQLRPHQWAKNLLVLMPLLAAHKVDEVHLDLIALLAFIVFSLCASSVYVLNDLLDLEADRSHPRKSKRPFAAGDLPLAVGLVLAPALLIAAAGMSAFLPARFCMVVATYYAATLAYSFSLKGLVLIDALSLAGLYTLRIIAGAAAVSVALSFWMLLFSVLLFLSLAFVKRFAELESLRRQQRLRTAGRGYRVDDLPALQSLGAAAGYLSALVLALYVNSPDIQALYRQPKVIWALCILLLYWVSRIWLTAQRGQMHDDPVVYALRDRESLAVGLIAVVTIALAV